MAERFCTRVGIIHHGELIATGSMQEIKDRAAAGSSLENAFLKITDDADQQAPVSSQPSVKAAA